MSKPKMLDVLFADWKEGHKLAETLCGKVRASKKKFYPYMVEDTGGADFVILVLNKPVPKHKIQEMYERLWEDGI